MLTADAAFALSMQEHPDAEKGVLRFATTQRGPLLPAYGTRERERVLRLYDRHDYATIWRGGRSVLTTKVVSTPWEIKSAENDVMHWQQVLMQAEFGGGWEQFIEQVVRDYLRHDSGAFVELIAPGDPREVPTGPIAGLAVLDNLRCYPTGDPRYPVIYYDLHGRMHVVHRSRVVQLLDSSDSEEDLAGYGECALSRAIAPTMREILINRYQEQFLDDKPPPGIVIFGNIAKADVQMALAGMLENKDRDEPDAWGRVVKLFGLDTDQTPTVEFVSYTKAPENFDPDEAKTNIAREIALAMGIDIQDIWELTGQGIGTGTQSEIMAQKSRGKGFGRLLKGIERVLNAALPPHVEFTFKYEDPQADMEEAQIMQTTASAVQTISGALTADEQRQLLANTNPAIHEVLVTADGTITRLSDADPKTEDQVAGDSTEVTEAPTLSGLLPAPDPMTLADFFAQKSLSDTFEAFAAMFVPAVQGASDGDSNAAALRSLLREQLRASGEESYEDGLRDGGADPDDATATERAARNRKVAEWLASQNAYINAFVAEVTKAGLSEGQIAMRADMWASKSLRSIYYAGLADASAEGRYQWELGNTEEHCETCLMANGQIHTMKEWTSSGILPGASTLKCKGYLCDCKLRLTNAARSGRLPGGKSSLGDRLLSWLRRIVGKG